MRGAGKYFMVAAVGAFIGQSATAGGGAYSAERMPAEKYNLGGAAKFDPFRPAESRFYNKIARRRGKKKGGRKK